MTSFPAIGTTVRKYFDGHGWFHGRVAFYTQSKFCRVIYEDGDAEDVLPAEVQQSAFPHSVETPDCVMRDIDLKHGASYTPPLVSSESSSDSEDGERRRSKRAKRSTVVYVGKDAVKRDNNYVVKGVNYEYRVFEEQDPPRKPKARPGTKPAATQPKKPRVVSATEQGRLEMKNRIQSNIEAKESSRKAFLYQHAARLRPFTDVVFENTKANPPVFEEVMQPDAIQADLRDYQLQGLNFMSAMYQQNMSMILGDEMGLGKTLQTLSLICHLKEKWGQEGPSLVVCPLSVLYSWCQEVEKWAPSLKYLRLHSNQANSDSQLDLTKYDVVITTYEMCLAPHLKSTWSRQHFNLLCLDEGHKIKCATTLISQAVRRVHSESRIILTGTPLANNLTELWALLNFLEPKVFPTSTPFDEAFDLVLNKVDNVKLAQAHELLKTFMLRRLKATVEQKLPPKLETRVECPLSNSQIWWYKALLVKDLSLVTNGTKSAAGKNVLNNLLMQLRKCCLHPFLFPAAETDPDSTSLEDLIGHSGKLAVLDLLLLSMYEKGHRVTLFSQFTRVLDILDDYCRLRGWEYCRFDGGTGRARRNQIINSFNSPGSKKFIFLMSTRSGGMGINLQTADTCILFDSDWNPQPDIQAIGRTHRLGQSKPVHVYRLCTVGTVEQRMQERAEKKLYLDRMVTRDGDRPILNQEDESGASNLLSTLRFGCNAVFGSAGKVHELPTVEDIEMITDRTRTEAFTSGRLKGGADMSTDTFDETKEMLSTTEFGGIDFGKLREEHKRSGIKTMGDIGEMWQKRNRINRIKMMDGNGSGYGSASVPVLASNDYGFETGEKSVFDRELLGKHSQNKGKKKAEKTFEHQDVCQACGDGGQLYCCPRCPVTLHLSCAGVRHAKELLCCSHHHCATCQKSASNAGGLIYPCTACPNAYCEDHLPADALVLEDGCDRMEGLGYYNKQGIYVLCCKHCEYVAKTDFGWKAPSLKKPPCPPPMEVSSFFGGQVDDNLKKDGSESLVIEGKRKRNKTYDDPSSRDAAVLAAAATTASTGHGMNMSANPPAQSWPTYREREPSTGQAYGDSKPVGRVGYVPSLVATAGHSKENNGQLPQKLGGSIAFAIDLCDD